MEPISITRRAASLNDVPFLTDCFMRSMRESITECRGHWDEDRERAQFHRQLDLASITIIRATDVDVGFVMLVEQAFGLQLHTLCVSPEWQNRGIGAHITRDAIQRATDQGRDLMLSVLKVNTRADTLYRRLGFVVVEESEHHRHMKYCGAQDATG